MKKCEIKCEKLDSQICCKDCSEKDRCIEVCTLVENECSTCTSN